MRRDNPLSKTLYDPGAPTVRAPPTKANQNWPSQSSVSNHQQKNIRPTSKQPAHQPQISQAPRGILNVSPMQPHVPSKEQFPERTIPESRANEAPSTQFSKTQEEDDMLPENPRLILQPVTRPISQEQLIAEVKGIYAGLVMVEGKCIQVDAKQLQLVKEAAAGQTPKLNNEQYQALIALHRTLLHEHHDFFLASQHPSATPGVRRLALKYAMPARLWKHGIHAFLELLRNRLPDSIEHMLAFIYLAYSMMTLLLETVPAFESTWIECLGDLARYRMAIVEKDPDDDHYDSEPENGDDESDVEERRAIRTRNEERNRRISTMAPQDAKTRKTRKKRKAYNEQERDTWTQVAFEWYARASNSSPEVGRLYHHLAILSQNDEVQQLFYYGKALVVPKPFEAAKESILTLFRPVFGQRKWRRSAVKVDKSFTTMHAVLFTRKELERFEVEFPLFIRRLDKYVRDKEEIFLESTGYQMAIANIQMLLDHGKASNPIVKALAEAATGEKSVEEEKPTDTAMSGTADAESVEHNPQVFEMAHRLFDATALSIFSRDNKKFTLSFLHSNLVFLHRLSLAPPEALELVEPSFAWAQLATVLNWILQTHTNIDYDRVLGATMPVLADPLARPFREDFALRQIFWTSKYYSPTFFDEKHMDREDQFKDSAKLANSARPERCLWLGAQLARRVSSLQYDPIERRFFVPAKRERKPLDIVTEYPTTESESVTLADDDVSMTSVRS